MTFHYSIIIPHYNIPDLLERLLNSIPKRDDTQIIVVDDCSPAESCKKLEEIKDKFPNAEFYSTGTNGGGGKARNVGLKHAKGKYVIFADADDFFTPELADILKSYAGNKEADIIYFNARSIDSATNAPRSRANQLNSFFKIAAKDREQGELWLRYHFGEPWCKIVRREIIEKNNIRFDEIPIHNDTFYSYMTAFHAKSVVIDPRIGYCITERSGSVSKLISDEKFLIRERVFSKKNRFLKEHSINFIDPLMLTPFTTTLKRRNFKLLSKLFKVAKENGYSKYEIVMDYLNFRKNRNS